MMLRAFSIAIYSCIALAVISMLLVLSSMWSGVEFGPTLVPLVKVLIAFMLLSVPAALVHVYQTGYPLARTKKRMGGVHHVLWALGYGPILLENGLLRDCSHQKDDWSTTTFAWSSRNHGQVSRMARLTRAEAAGLVGALRVRLKPDATEADCEPLQIVSHLSVSAALRDD
jgi:hypothetical protein